MSITDELNNLISMHGNARDALNVTLAKLRQAKREIDVLKERVAELENQAVGNGVPNDLTGARMCV